MKTIIKGLNRIPLTLFAEKHSLTMVLTQIKSGWKAKFLNETSNHEGFGGTQRTALENYADKISDQPLCINGEWMPTPFLTVPSAWRVEDGE